MNTLLFVLIRALRTHSWLRLLLCAFVLSSLGNGLTQVLVFGQLLRWHASPSTLTLAYLLATLPGFVGSLAGEKLCRHLSPVSLLIFAELLGMIALVLPLTGLVYHNIPALLMVQSTEAFLGGISWPALALVFKRGLTHDELPAATGMESVIFASQVLLGTGAGVLLFDHVAPLMLLSIDALSFLASAMLLMLTRTHYCAHDIGNSDNSQPTLTVVWSSLTTAQKRSLLILPALAAVGSPAMALLPALAQQIRPDDASGLALPLLFARSLGQLCGPLLLNGDKLPHYARRNYLLLLCMAIFLGAYGLLPLLSGEKIAALGLIFIAHLASNVVFAVGTFCLLAGFSGDEIPAASAKAWRWQTLTATLMTTIAAFLASKWGAAQALYSVSLSALLLMSVVMVRYRQ